MRIDIDPEQDPEQLPEYTVPVKNNVYAGSRTYGMSLDRTLGRLYCDVFVNGDELSLRLDLWNHSPDGFNWGYGGSGPAQLALAILAYELDYDNLAIMLHQEFKWRVVSHFSDNWTLTSEIIRMVVGDIMTSNPQLAMRAKQI